MTAIRITRDDIDRGEAGSEEACALAQASKRAFPDALLVWVSTGNVVVRVWRYDWYYPLDEAAQAWVESYDQGEPCEPALVRLGEPTPHDREGGGWPRVHGVTR